MSLCDWCNQAGCKEAEHNNPRPPTPRSRHRVGYMSYWPCFYCTALAGEECRDEPDKRAEQRKGKR